MFEEHISGAKRNKERPVLTDAVGFCLENKVGTFLVSEMSRLGRNAFEVLSTVKALADNGVNLYLQKEQLTLFDDEGNVSFFFPIVIATLSTCAQLERENIQFRLQSGREQYKKKGGKLGRPIGSVKSMEKKREEYKDVIKMHVQNNMTMKSFHEAKNKKLNSIDSVMNKIYICITV